jgi:hypothetical protein
MEYFHSQMTRMYKESNREKVFFFYLFKKKLRITMNPGNTDLKNVPYQKLKLHVIKITFPDVKSVLCLHRRPR